MHGLADLASEQVTYPLSQVSGWVREKLAAAGLAKAESDGREKTVGQG